MQDSHCILHYPNRTLTNEHSVYYQFPTKFIFFDIIILYTYKARQSKFLVSEYVTKPSSLNFHCCAIPSYLHVILKHSSSSFVFFKVILASAILFFSNTVFQPHSICTVHIVIKFSSFTNHFIIFIYNINIAKMSLNMYIATTEFIHNCFTIMSI